MMPSDLHSFALYIFFGFLFVFPLILICLKLFRISDPKERMSFYVLGLLTPVVGFFLFGTVLTKRCESGSSFTGPLAGFFDILCLVGAKAISFLGPVMMGLVLIGLLRAGAGAVYQARLRTKSVEPDPDQLSRILNILNQRCTELKLDVPEVIFSTRNSFVAILLGWVRPVLVINVAILETLSDRELDMVLTHELVHLRRGDVWVSWLLHLLRDLVFFSPFSTILLNNYLVERERICDLESAEISGDKHSYAATLVKAWRLLLDTQEGIPVPSAGLIGKRNDMEYRITSLLAGKTKKKQPVLRLWLVKSALAVTTILFLGIIC